MSAYKNYWDVLEDWGISNPTEQDVWEAIAELNGVDYCEIADGDLAEWL